MFIRKEPRPTPLAFSNGEIGRNVLLLSVRVNHAHAGNLHVGQSNIQSNCLEQILARTEIISFYAGEADVLAVKKFTHPGGA